MFGYIRAFKPEMKVKEYETYKSVYCALCRDMGKRYGVVTRLSLNYDFTFLALLNIALSDSEVSAQRKRCVCNPFKKCNYCVSGDDYAFASAATVILIYYKILDNISDEKYLKKLGALALKMLYATSHKKAAEQYPEIEQLCKEYMCQQNAVEKENCQSADKAAHPTAKFMEQLFAFCSDEPSKKRVLARIGYCLGRWIYLIDAIEDIDKDRKNGSYNPYLLCDETKDLNSLALKDTLKESLQICEAEAQRAYELLGILKFEPIISNILYLGLENSRIRRNSK